MKSFLLTLLLVVGLAHRSGSHQQGHSSRI